MHCQLLIKEHFDNKQDESVSTTMIWIQTTLGLQGIVFRMHVYIHFKKTRVASAELG